jgi:predicted TIM-barrel fold metal-dependent hydrolase
MAGIVSVDDHVVEPRSMWCDRLSVADRSVGPHIVRERIKVVPGLTKDIGIRFEADDGPGSRWADIWEYEDVRVPLQRLAHCAGFPIEDQDDQPMVFEEMRTGCYDPIERVADMDTNSVDISLCFPNTFTRFAGQRFLAGKDKSLALKCVKAYNDWIVEEWSAPSNGRLTPLTIVPLWDVDLAVAEVRRNAARGVRHLTFSEQPTYLGLPSIFSGYWDPLLAVCEETNTVICLHIGSGSRLMGSSDDAPRAVASTMTFGTAALALLDWLMSGHFVTFPKLTVLLAECQIGWIPYILERADVVWSDKPSRNQVSDKLPHPPTHYFRENMFVSFFSDAHGLRSLGDMDTENVCFETDYPHSDGTWPHSAKVFAEQTAHLDEATRLKIARTNGLRAVVRD